MKSLGVKLKKFWLSPAPADRLAILRIASGGYALWYLVTRYSMIKRISLSDHHLYEPMGVVNLLAEPLHANIFAAILFTGLLLNIAYIIGWKYKWTGPLFAIFLLFILSYRNSWSMLYHTNIALVLHVLVIGLVKAADALSVDAFLKSKKSISHWQYGWPIKLVCGATLITYFLSGMAKVLGDLAFQWINGDAMRSQVAVDSLRKDLFGESVSPLFEFIYPHTELFLLMGITTFILELGAPFALVNRRISKSWAILMFLMHWGIFFIMGIRFRYQMSGLIFLPFFEMEKLKNLFTGRRKRKTDVKLKVNSEPSVVLFDGVCNFCDGTVQFIIGNDSKDQFQFASLQSETGQQLLEPHGIASDLSTIVLIEGEKHYLRSTAILRIISKLKAPVSWLYVLMLVPEPLREAGYRLFARNRYQWFGRKNTCQIPTSEVRAKFL